VIRSVVSVLHADPHSLVLEVPDWPGHVPGQFAMLSFGPLGISDPLLPRPMAVFMARGTRVEFRHKIVGRGTELLASLPTGSRLGIVGPLGNGFPATAEPLVLVGGGTGIASLFELAQAHPGSQVLLGGRSKADILARQEFATLEVDLQLATDDGSIGHRGLVTDLLNPRPGERVYACGPTAMMQVAHEKASKASVPSWVSLENQMACGFGVCLGCVISGRERYRYVCTDGPVFEGESVDWERLP